MADPQRGDEFPEDEEGGGESTVSMASPTLDPSGMPSPISVPPGGGAAPPNLSAPTAPAPFTPQAPFAMSGKRPGPPQPSVATPFGGLTPGAPPAKPIPAAGAPPPRQPAPGPQATGAAGASPLGIKRPQTVIGLAPPPVGSPRPGQAGSRVPLPTSGGKPMAPRAGAPGVPPSSGRGVTPAKPSSSAKPMTPPAESAPEDDTDDRYSPSKQGRTSVPDSQKEDFATMAKSPEESLALFGLDSGVSDAARAAVGAKPGLPAKPPPGRSPLASTNLAPPGKPLGPSSSRPGGSAALPPPSSKPQMPAKEPAKDIAVLHDRNEEEESTRAVSREEMLRGHDASVVIGEDSEAHGDDATLAIAPGYNEANSSQAAAFAATMAKNHQGAPPPPPGFDPNFGQPPPPAPPHGTHAMPNQGWPQPQPMAPPHGWQDPNAYQGHGNPQSYPGMSVGPVSGPHLPAQSWTPNQPPSQPHFPAGAPQSQPHMQVAQSANQPIPYPGQPGLHHPLNPFEAPKKQSKLSGQIVLLGIVGVVCLAIFITGIVLFATTKF